MRKLMWFTIGAATAGTVAVYFARGMDLAVFAAAAFFMCVVFGIISCFRKHAKAVCAAFLGAATLFAWIIGFQSLYLEPMRAFDGQTLDLTITLTEYSSPTPYGISVEGYVQLGEMPYRILAYVNDDLQLKPGDTVIGGFRLEDTTADPESNYQMGNGIYLIGYPKGDCYVRNAPEIPWYGYPAYLGTSIRALLHNTFPEDTLGFAQALLLGDTGLIDYETDTALKISGIRHIIAVSGLHVSILFSMIQTLTGKRKWLSAILGLPLLFLFAAVAGFSPSITRACIMHSLMMIALLFEREYDPPAALAFAVLTMLAVNPYCAASVSLQLSVGCLCGIFLFSGRIRAWFMDEKRLGHFKGRRARLASWFSGSVAVSVSATLVTTPLCAFYYGTVSLVSVLTNLLTLWVVTFIFYGIVLTCMLAWIVPVLGTAMAWIVSWPMRYVLLTAKVLAALPLSAVYTVSIYIVLFLVFSYILLAVYFCMDKKRPLPLLCCLALGLCLSLGASWLEPMGDDVRMTVLDVGQGQCIIVQSEGKTFLIDCGGDSDSIAADAAAEMLLSMGISRVDGIILTHYDRDHAGGATNLLTRIDADVLYLPDCLDTDGYSAPLLAMENALLVDSNMEITFGDTKISLITTDYGFTNNESGLCVLFQRHDCDILVTGDRNTYGEKDLLRQIELPDLEVLIVGHHGSRYSTGDELLATGRPDIAIISVGENSYGHPTEEVLQRLREHGCEVYRTDENGTVIFRR